MIKGFNILLVSALILIFAISANGQIVERSSYSREKVDIKIYFPYDEAYLDSTYMGNLAILQTLDTLLRDTAFISTLKTIEITAQSSPEGTYAYNTALSNRRRETIKEYLTTTYPHIEPTMWDFKALPENWELFHHNLVADPNLPEKERVLAISSANRKLDDKEWLLKTMDGGEPWKYIKEHILPKQRFGAGIVFIPLEKTEVAAPIGIDLEPISHPVIGLPQQLFVAEEEIKALVAIKTNLLYDLASVLNIELEVPIGDRFSLTGEYLNPWWYGVNAGFTMRFHSFTVGAKYWLGDRSDREQLTGWAVGANFGYAKKYDVEIFSPKGVQGDYLMGGATVSYAHKLCKHLNMEYQLGLGATISDYRNYTLTHNTEHGSIKVFDYPWLDKRKTIIGPTQLRVSLVYTIFGTKKIER